VSKRRVVVVKTKKTYYYKGSPVSQEMAKTLKSLGVTDVRKRVTDEMVWGNWK
jgi:hypothetical protein